MRYSSGCIARNNVPLFGIGDGDSLRREISLCAMSGRPRDADLVTRFAARTQFLDARSPEFIQILIFGFFGRTFNRLPSRYPQL
eukprot:scaffold34601_cov234-Amphora_coffeaeformis.AAC.15